MVALHWDLGNGWEKFEGKDEEECFILAMKSRGFKIKDCGGCLFISKDGKNWGVLSNGMERKRGLVKIIKEELPDGIGRLEVSIGTFKYEKSLRDEKVSFGSMRALSLYLANNVYENALDAVTFSLAGIEGFISLRVMDDLCREDRKILSASLTIYEVGSGLAKSQRKFYQKFFRDDKKRDVEFLSARILEPISSCFFNCFDDELCEKLREVSNRGRG